MARRRLPWLSCLAIATAIALGLYVSFGHNAELVAIRINQVGIEVERRVQWWNWKNTPEEDFCWASHDRSAGKDKIPNVVHFVLLADHDRKAELSYARFLAIKAALLRAGAAEVKVHSYALNTANRWWKLLEPHVSLVIHASDELEGPHGLSMQDLRLAHQADLLRLNILLQEGGIYLDTDIYTLRSFSNLLTNPRDAIMGHEGGNRYGLCNAVIVARADSLFLTKWLATYSTFNRDHWNEHSVRKPKQLQAQYPDLICPLSPTAFYWPTWAQVHVDYMYDPVTPDEIASLRANMSIYDGAMYADQLAIHGWGAHERLKALTEENIQTEENRFNILLRDIATAPL